MQNFEFLALKITELWLFKYFWQLLTAFNSCQQLSKYFLALPWCLSELMLLAYLHYFCVNSLPQHFPDFIQQQQHHSTIACDIVAYRAGASAQLKIIIYKLFETFVNLYNHLMIKNVLQYIQLVKINFIVSILVNLKFLL